MIEVIYKEEKQEAEGNEEVFRIPRNIRQIGLVNEDYRIYIEDYVYTFLGRLAGADKEKENSKGCLAVLTGETKWSEGTTYLFIRGALMVENVEAAADHIDFTEEIWTKIYEEQEKYFPEQEIVGWFFSQAQVPVEITEIFTRVHLKYFGGEKVLMLMEPVEREDAFFRYENSSLVRQEGYYIYYEKNPLMQAYMLEKNQDIQPASSEEVEDEAVKNFRKIIKMKKKQEPEKTEDPEEKPSVFSYAATACLAIAILAVGVNFYQNYKDMQSVKNQTQVVSSVIKEEVTPSIAPAVTPTPKAVQTPAQSTSTGNSLNSSRENVSDKNAGGSGAGESGAVSGQQIKSQSADGTSAGEDSSGQQSQGTAQQEGQTAESSDVYQEESDVRKAKRREELAAKEQAAAQNGGEQSDAGNDNETASSTEIHDTYVIRPGDTLFQISMARYGNMETIQEICRLNGLSEDEIIYPGQVIVLP
ncbi:MAG: LysM domain-containing protein [Eubacteriales bacterium]|nr:LysM domain-containing protein [Eubacteriales bacterium]